MQQTDNGEKNIGRRLVGFFVFPIALLPLFALISYNWRDISVLCVPPLSPTENLIGAVGDGFAYMGYQLFGLAVWTIPVLCILVGLLLIFGHTLRPGRRTLGVTLFLFSGTCLLQLTGATPMVRSLMHTFNIAPNAGGALGYLVMTRSLAHLLSPFGAGILMLSLMLFSILLTIGLQNIIAGLAKLTSWAADRDAKKSAADDAAQQRELEAIRAAQDAAKAQRLAEKQRIADEKAAEKAARQAAKEEENRRREAERQAVQNAKEALRAERPSGGSWFHRSAPVAVEPAAEPADVPAVSNMTVPAAPVPSPVRTAEPAVAGPTDGGGENKGPYVLPSPDLLNEVPLRTNGPGEDVSAMAERLIDTLKVFDVNATLAYTVAGPVVTQYALSLDLGTRVEKVAGLSRNLQMTLQAKSLRIQAPIPGKNAVGIEVPNANPVGVSFREIIDGEDWQKLSPSKYNLPLLLGKDAAGKDLIVDLTKLPHLLVAGATGQGKSVCLNSIIMGLLMCRTPEQLRFIMVDPKCVEFTAYSQLPHLLVPVINDTKKVVFGLRWAVVEMEKRLKMFKRACCRNIVDFNKRKSILQQDFFEDGKPTGPNADLPATIPYIVIVIDEVADIMQTAGKEVEPVIARLTALARATGIHLILATQRPDTKTITGTIKSNIPGRIAFKTSSAIDSRTILDAQGSESLIGKGDMLFKTAEGILLRAQGSYISDEEINRVIAFIGEHASVQFDETFTKRLDKIKESAPEDALEEAEDETEDTSSALTTADGTSPSAGSTQDKDDILYHRALEVLRDTKRASTSHLQRRMAIGYNHAARLIDLLESRGVIGPSRGAGPRELLQDPEVLLAQLDGTAAAGDGAGEVTELPATSATEENPGADAFEPLDPPGEEV